MEELKFNDYVERRYKYTGEFHEGLAVVKNNEGKYGFINKKGIEVIPCQYLDAEDFSEGLAAVRNNDELWGYINEQGEEVIPCQFRGADIFSEGLAVVENENSDYIYIDKNGLQAIDFKYTYASPFHEGYAIVKHKGSILYNYLDKKGHHNGRYHDATMFLNGSSIVTDDENIYIIDTSFETSASKKLKKKDILSILICNNGYFLIKNDCEKYGYLSKNLEKITPITFKYAGEFNDGLAVVELSESFIGFINEEGKITAFSKQHQYQEIRDFHEGLAAVQNSQGLWGYINKDGKEVVPCQFKQADNFSEGLAGVMDQDDVICYIDKKGKQKITLDNIYYSSLELSDKTITIKAGTPQELSAEKLRVLSIAKEEIIAATINAVDQLAFDESAGLYKPQTRRRTKQKGNNKQEN